MTKFSDKPWEERKKWLGGPAEDAFKRYAAKRKIQIDRYGFDYSPIEKFPMLPEFIRFTPDFVCVGTVPFLVECKGTGAGRYVSLKEVIIPSLLEWDKLAPVYLFFYDSSTKKVSFNNNIVVLMKQIEDRGYQKGVWHDEGVDKPHFKIPKSDLRWEDDDGVDA